MTVSPPPQQHASKDAQAARKRRRRAPAGGAADDCFTCMKRNTKCDRRRPYCSQCLEIGNECSGYKTQLTWGVGVASRGKLRGLSLPIAKAPPVAAVAKKTPSPRSRTNSVAPSGHWSRQDDASRRSQQNGSEAARNHAGSLPATPFTVFNEFAGFSQSEATPSTTAPSWNSITYSGGLTGQEQPRIQRLNTSLGPFPVMGDGLSSSVESLSDPEYSLSPMSHTYSREDMPFMNSPGFMYGSCTGQSSPGPQSPASNIVVDQRAPTSCPSCPSLVYAASEQSSSISSHQEPLEAQTTVPRLLADSETLGTPEIETYGSSPRPSNPQWSPSIFREESGTPNTLDQPKQLLSGSPYTGKPAQVSCDLISRMPFLMDYYENIMCPSMVLIDGPTNPFRNHILRLASNSQSLQHAICALAACNLRMKRRLSLGQHARESPDRFGIGAIDGQTEDQPMSEEYQHRNLAIHLLNQQLNDPMKSFDDSVLATILILCHYRMAESGIAKFKIQFAGVKKILEMRSAAPYQTSGDSAWMEAIFTYFDAISASINNREPQLNQTFYGITPEAHLLPPGAENWVGCDRELFKTIAKLGRLNLLSQDRPMSPRSVGTPLMSPPLCSPYAQSLNQNSQTGDYFSMAAQSQCSGNSGLTARVEDQRIVSPDVCTPISYDGQPSIFWLEWREARTALQSWEFDPQRLMNTLPCPPTPSQIRDLGSLSEAFRYAALLYTERLASPSVPSTHNNFRNLVSQVIYYASLLQAGSSAEKFLLWPLFVAGSECVNELQQNIVRNKCREIMSRSGYMNNLSAIEILERLWAGEYQQMNPENSMNELGQRRGPFNWTKTGLIGGPGVELEWIMF